LQVNYITKMPAFQPFFGGMQDFFVRRFFTAPLIGAIFYSAIIDTHLYKYLIIKRKRVEASKQLYSIMQRLAI